MPSPAVVQRSFQFVNRQLTGSLAPVVEIRGFDAATGAVNVSLLPSTVTLLWQTGSRVGVGDIKTWVPANTKKARLVMWSASTDTAGEVALRHNTGTLGAPVWTTLQAFFLPANGSLDIAVPDQPSTLTGDGVGAVFKVEALAGAGNWRASLHGYDGT